MRTLLIIAAFFVVLLILRQLFGRRQQPKPPAPAGDSKNMVSCSHCGLHLPESEALRGNGRYYCCEDHRRADD